MPYRLDLHDAPEHALDVLVDLGALDVEPVGGGLSALMPDAVPASTVEHALGRTDLCLSPAVGRDDDSVWTLEPRAVRTRTLVIVPTGMPASADAIRIVDSPAFGTGLHATTALCLGAIEDLLDVVVPARMLDVGTGSGILALAALRRGVARAVGIDRDAKALGTAAENARLNECAGRLALVHGGPDAVRGSWPLVVANIRAAELMEMALTLARLTASQGRLVLSGIPASVASEVERTYRRLGMTQVGEDTGDGWVAQVFHPSW